MQLFITIILYYYTQLPIHPATSKQASNSNNNNKNNNNQALQESICEILCQS